MLYDILVIVKFLDAAERIAQVVYALREQYDETANGGDGNWADVFADAVLLITGLNVLTMDAIIEYGIQMVVAASGTPNVASNNQVRAFTRTTLDNDAGEGSFIVPAWDDIVFDEDSNNLLSPAYNTAASAVSALLKDPETGEDFVSTDWTQSRAYKGRNTIS